MVFPAIRSAVFAGTLLTFSRCLGEFGSVILVSGNRTGNTLTAPVFIFSSTSQFRFAEAAAVATLLFAISFVLVLVTGSLLKRREEDVVSSPRRPASPSDGRRGRRLIIAAAAVWVGLLLLLPMIAIIWTVVKAGWSA